MGVVSQSADGLLSNWRSAEIVTRKNAPRCSSVLHVIISDCSFFISEIFFFADVELMKIFRA